MSVDYVPVPAAELVFGVSGGERHIVTGEAAGVALDLAGGDPRLAHAAALCRRVVKVATAWGPYSRDAALEYPPRCPDCAWILALHRGDVDEEVAAFTTHDAFDAAAIAARLGEGVGERLLDAIAHDPALWQGADRLGPSHRSQLLGHASRHLPAVTVCEECAEIGVANAHGYGATCPAQEVACLGCTVTAHGLWAGEWEGTFLPECTVAAPCSVLTTLAVHYRIPIAPAASS
ncbi:hypothetical protein BH09ACT8_BH09ACT8_56050 [soil metagenome]